MKEKIITKELAKLYEKQGYLEDSLTCYSSLYEQTNKQEFADAIKKIKNKINPVKNKSADKGSVGKRLVDERLVDERLVDEKPDAFWTKPSDFKENDDKSTRVLSLFEQWVNMIVLEKKIQNFKKNQAK